MDPAHAPMATAKLHPSFRWKMVTKNVITLHSENHGPRFLFNHCFFSKFYAMILSKNWLSMVGTKFWNVKWLTLFLVANHWRSYFHDNLFTLLCKISKYIRTWPQEKLPMKWQFLEMSNGWTQTWNIKSDDKIIEPQSEPFSQFLQCGPSLVTKSKYGKAPWQCDLPKNEVNKK